MNVTQPDVKLSTVVWITFFLLMGLVITRNQTFFVTARLLLPVLALTYVSLTNRLVDWEQLHLSMKLFLVFGFYVFLKSVLQGFVLSSDYQILVEGTPYIGFLWILEVNQLWGFAYLLVILSLTQNSNNDFAKRLVFYFFGWGLLVCLTGSLIPYFFQGGYKTGEALRVFSDQPTDSAKIINLFLFIVGTGLIIDARNWFRKGLYLGLCLSGGVAVYLTQSRAGIGSLLLGVMVFFIFFLGRNFNRSAFIKIILLVLGFLVVMSLLPGGTHEALEHEIVKTSQQTLTGSSNRWKYIWPSALDLIIERPVFGHPLGSYPIRIKSVINPNAGWPAYTHPHNIWLQLLFHGGVIGLLLIVAALSSLMFQSVKGYFYSQSGSSLHLAVLCATLAVVCVQGLVDGVYYSWMALLFVQFALAESIESNVGEVFR